MYRSLKKTTPYSHATLKQTFLVSVFSERLVARCTRWEKKNISIMSWLPQPKGVRTLALLLISLDYHTRIDAFSPSQVIVSLKELRTRHYSSYGKDAEIWPPTNEEPVNLRDSFPGGIVPDNIISAQQSLRTSEIQPVQRRIIPRILRRAASAQDQALAGDRPSIDRAPIIIAAGLSLSGFVRPLDVLISAFLSGYTCLLFAMAKSVRSDGRTPTLPALPPQGHVPSLVANPLGYSMTNSANYNRWLQAGFLIGLVGPLIQVVRGSLNGEVAMAQNCGRPLFLLCIQAFSENMSRRALTPLPIRVFVPIAYNTVRIGYMWQWVGRSIVGVDRGLALVNFIYWSLNLLGFLLPVVAIRYMRAHFFSVEASQASIQSGLEDSIGLTPY